MKWKKTCLKPPTSIWACLKMWYTPNMAIYKYWLYINIIYIYINMVVYRFYGMMTNNNDDQSCCIYQKKAPMIFHWNKSPQPDAYIYISSFAPAGLCSFQTQLSMSKHRLILFIFDFYLLKI
jgi:hypothetical protein